ncbi:PQQ-dependent sugar dehydrogenase [Pseudohoeflea coraliihabitans]
MTVKTREHTVAVEVLAEDLVHPWAVEDMGDGGLLITERPGRLRLFRDGRLSAPIAGLPDISATGQGGLLDIALSADFAESRMLYLSYSTAGQGGTGTAIARARLSGDASKLEAVEEIFRMNHFTDKTQHYGSRIAVGGDGSLFFTIGDRGESERAQDPGDHAGSVLHIMPDGSIPAGTQSAPASWQPEIWSIGHRNPQGLAFDRETGTLYAVEHGARGGDEVNRPQAALNYGWPIISYGRHYSGAEIGRGTAAEGYEQPIHYWDPSIAPGGMTVYRGTMFPEWQGDIFVAALKFQLLVRLDHDPESGEIRSEERLLKGDFGRLRDVITASDGALLIVTDEEDGKLLRLSNADAQAD